MDKTTIVMIAFCVILAGTFLYLYYSYDIKDPVGYSNVSISAEIEGKKIITGFVVETDKGETEGNTSRSYEKFVVNQNQVIKIKNKNIGNQTYYIESKEVNITSETHRIIFKLEEPKEIKTKVLNSNPIVLFLESENARNTDFCLSWSLNYIFVEAVNYTTRDQPENYKSWKCYRGFSLLNSNETIQIDYSKFGTPNENDYIKILLFSDEIESQEEQILKLI